MSNIGLKSLTALFILSLSGCAVQQPRPPNPTGECLAMITLAPEVQPIADKLIFGKRASLQMVSDSTRVTPAQQPAIQAAEARYDACIELAADWRRNFMPLDAQALGMRFVRDSQASIALLYRGEISFGQYNTHSNAMRADLEQRMRDLGAASQRQEDEFRRREAIARIMAPPTPPLPVVQFTPIQPLPRAVTTTCRKVGLQVECRTE